MYQRGKDDIERYRNKDMYMSNHIDVYTSLGTNLNIYKPYNGLYIKSNKILLENIIEKIEIGEKNYRVCDFNTISKKLNSDDYLEKIDETEHIYTYNVSGINYVKKIGFINGTDILCVEYFVKSMIDEVSFIKVIPFLTYRDLFLMKKSNVLKFNKREINKGIVVNLSVTNNQNLIIKSDKSEYEDIDSYLNNVSHEYLDENLVNQLYIEDLYIPGEFSFRIEPNSESHFRIFISSYNFNINKLEENAKVYIPKEWNIKEQYVELKKLSKAIEVFDTEEICSSIPKYINFDKYINTTNVKNLEFLSKELIDVVKAIEGQYLIPRFLNKAVKRINQIISYIGIMEKNNKVHNILILKLWLVEIINKLYDIDKNLGKSFVPFLNNTIKEARNTFVNNYNEYFLKLENIVLLYNAFRIYEKLTNDLMYVESTKKIKEDIYNNFYDENLRVLKYDLNENEVYATPEMLYALSLSYEAVDTQIGIKILDSAFKELYTPYGLRRVAKSSSKYDNIIYPKFMVHFVKANLRQNGVTIASQKIAYNLVKELLHEIDVETCNTVKYVYHEKNKYIDSLSNDLLTTAEMIRLYDLLV